jgi:hypothetical protein
MTMHPHAVRSAAARGPPTITRPPLGPLRRLAPAAPLRSEVLQLQNNDDDSLLRPGDEEVSADPALGIITPQFPFPVRIPSFLLNEHLQIRGKEFIEGIATSSHVDHIQELLLYRVHLEHGFSININVGFVQIVLEEGEENETHQNTTINNTTYFEDNEEGGRPSSCDELEDEDDYHNLWAPELLHSQSEDFFFTGIQDDLQGEAEVDTEVEEAARSLMDYGDDKGGFRRSDTVGRGQRVGGAALGV